MAEADKRVAQRGVHRSTHSGSMSKSADTKGWRRIAAAMLTASSRILGINLCSPEAGWGQEDTSWKDLYLALQLTEAHISFSQRDPYPIQVLDAKAALARGISQDAVDLAQEMVALENELICTAFYTGIADISKLGIDFSKYPKIQAYHRLATANSGPSSRFSSAETAYVVLDRAYACSAWLYPAPEFEYARQPVPREYDKPF